MRSGITENRIYDTGKGVRDMKRSEGLFVIKLYELEQQYGRMQSRLRLCQQEDHPKIRQELQKATDEYKEN